MPLIISCPSLFTSSITVTDDLVGLVDIAPTILHLLGLPGGLSMSGRNLFGEYPPDRRLYIESQGPLYMTGWSPLAGLRTLKYKFIKAPVPELYALAEDPGELDNLWSKDTAIGRQLAADLKRMPGGATHGDASLLIADEVSERLYALGYVHAENEVFSTDDSLPDPKDMIGYSPRRRISRNFTRRVSLRRLLRRPRTSWITVHCVTRPGASRPFPCSN